VSLESAFREMWDALAPIGREPSTGGYRRFAYTEADLACRAWFAEAARTAGLDVETDRNGNQWAWWGAPGPDAVVTGSHLDSVPDGGAYDGPLGVVSALLAVRTLAERGVRPERPVAVVNFADEEGARFGVACAGSRLLTGSLDPDRARALTDAGGVTLAEAMRAAGHDPGALGRDDDRLASIGVYVELHVEQGRHLADVPAAVGVATAIWPHGRWRCSFHGEANHAGTTRLRDRRDPMLPFAHTVIAARAAAERADAVATVGRVRVEPNGTNAVPSAVHAWLDARAPDDAALERVVGDVGAAAERAAAGHGVTVEMARESASPVVEFGADLRDRLVKVLAPGHGTVPTLPTGAGHDAGVLSAHVPAAMLFVRSPDGVSHSPAEHAAEDDCLTGIRALTAVLADLVGGVG
jgi:N-carbamoyl-L-amino-acid hydrolase